VFAGKVTPATDRLPTRLSEAGLRLSDVGGVALGGGGGGGGGVPGVQPERVTVTDVEPSPTVALHVLDRNPEALNLNSPFPSALPVAVDSGEETVIVALARAPAPSTLSVLPLSDARLTLTAASASVGATNSPTMTSSNNPLERRTLFLRSMETQWTPFGVSCHGS
jgi:hypothetical protein